MNYDRRLKPVVEQLAVELGLPKALIWKTWYAYWKSIQERIESQSISQDGKGLNFSIQHLGKLWFNYEAKEDKTFVHSSDNNSVQI